MKRSELTFEDSPIFGEKQGRKATTVKLEDLKGDNQDFETYTGRLGDIFIFPTLDAVKIKKQPISKGSTTKSTIINCIRIRNGAQTNSWFNVGSTGKRDVNNNKVHELFEACADNEERVRRLCELGAIEVADVQDVVVPLFEDKPGPDGKFKRKTKVVTDPDGIETRIEENGTQKDVPVYRKYELDDEE